MENGATKPFLKWAGGKRRLLAQFLPHFGPHIHNGRYFEPFLGGAAVFFGMQPRRAVLSDINAELIEVYQIVKQRPEELIDGLRIHKLNHCKDYYYKVREWQPETAIGRAGRFLYLNKTCYNGLYRVNRAGRFNVPMGKYKNPDIVNADGLQAASEALQTAEIYNVDFEAATAGARAGDFVYFDPPYAPLSVTSVFTSYTAAGFTAEDQARLRDVVQRLTARGVKTAVSNSAAPLIYDLYDGLRIIEIAARRNINSKAEGRGEITELLIMNY